MPAALRRNRYVFAFEVVFAGSATDKLALPFEHEVCAGKPGSFRDELNVHSVAPATVATAETVPPAAGRPLGVIVNDEIEGGAGAATVANTGTASAAFPLPLATR
jgi:hypothetical protein